MKQISNLLSSAGKAANWAICLLCLFLSPINAFAQSGSEDDTAFGIDSTNPTATVVVSGISGGIPLETITVTTDNTVTGCPDSYSYDLLIDGVIEYTDFCNLTDFDISSLVTDVSSVIIISVQGYSTDGTDENILVDLTVNASWGAGSESAIIDFSIPSENGPAIIDPIAQTIDIEATFGTDISALIPEFELSFDATATIVGVEQLSGVSANDYTSSVVYTVTSGDGTSVQDWTINITAAAAPLALNDMLSFSINGVPGIIDGNDITVGLGLTTDLTNLIAEFTSSVFSTVEIAGELQESGLTTNDFSTELTYTVIAQDETSTQAYTVTVNLVDVCGSTVVIDAAATIDETDQIFSLVPTAGEIVTIDFSTWAVDAAGAGDVITIYNGADLTAPLYGVYEVGTTNPGPITSTADDGSLTIEFSPGLAWANDTEVVGLVTCNLASSENDILSFYLENQTGDATIDFDNHTIDVEVGIGTGVIGLVPDFTISEEAEISLGGETQISGETSNDYELPLVFSIMAQDGTVQEWTVTVVESLTLSDANDILSFSIDGIEGTIGDGTIDLDVNPFYDITSLTPELSFSPFSVVTVDGVVQESGLFTYDFTSPITYTVVAQNGSMQDYIVSVIVEDICATGFSIETEDNADQTYTMVPPAASAISLDFTNWDIDSGLFGDHVSIYNGVSTSDDNLVGDYYLTSTNPGPIVSASPDGALTFVFDASGLGGTSLDATISCVPASAENDILSFEMAEQTGPAVIDDIAHTITIEVSFSTDLSGLIPDFSLPTAALITQDGLDQESGVTVNDYTAPLIYLVTAQDGSVQEWTVTVSTAATANDENDMLSFSIGGVEAIIGETTIDLELDPFADVSGLIADFNSSPFSTVDVAGLVQESGATGNNYNATLIYTVTAEDGTTKEYTVNVYPGLMCGFGIDFPSEFEYYGPFEDESWIIEADTPGDVVTISFSAFSTEFCCDHLYVYDGTDDEGLLLADLSGTAIPEDISSANGLYLNFVSENGVVDTGFVLDISCEAPSSDATLSDLLVDGVPVPGFNPDTDTYTITLPEGTTIVPTVTAIGTDDGAIVSISDLTSLPGDVVITILAEDGSTEETYTITFEIFSDTEEAKLFDITVDGESLVDFDSETFEYTVYVPVGTTEVPDVSGIAISSEATVILNNATAIPGTTTIEVISEDFTVELDYIIHFAFAVGVDELDQNKFMVYPNPSTTTFYIQTKTESTCQLFYLMATDGQLVREIAIHGNETAVDVSQLANGVYYLRSCDTTQKLIIRH